MERERRLLAASSEVLDCFERAREATSLPGFTMGVVHNGELVIAHGAGALDLHRPGEPSAQSVYRIASMTKSFTAAAVLKLRDEGVLALHDPVTRWVPEFAHAIAPTRDSAPITLFDLLCMRAGMPQDDPWADRHLWMSDAELSALFAQGLSFSTPPVTGFEYSNYAYILLGRVISQASGVAAMRYIDEALIAPLGLRHSVWNPAQVPQEQLARGYRQDVGQEDGVWSEEPPIPNGGDIAAFAGLYSCVADLGRWMSMFMAAWPPRDDDETLPLKRSSLREMQIALSLQAPRLSVCELDAFPEPVSAGYGFGLQMNHWQAKHGRDRWDAGHGGGLPGFGSHMRWSVQAGVGVVALANRTYAPMHAPVSEALALLTRALTAAPTRLPAPSDALLVARDGIIRLLEEWEPHIAADLFAGNFFDDRDAQSWQQEFERLRTRHGALGSPEGFAVLNRLRGRFRLAAERGWLDVWVTLSPTRPARIQLLQFTSLMTPSEGLAAMGEACIAAINDPAREQWMLDRLAPGTDAAALTRALTVARVRGGCAGPGLLLACDGSERATWRVQSARADYELELRLDTEDLLAGWAFTL